MKRRFVWSLLAGRGEHRGRGYTASPVLFVEGATTVPFDKLLFAERVKAKIGHGEVLGVGGSQREIVVEGCGSNEGIGEGELDAPAGILVDQSPGLVGGGLVHREVLQ